MEDINQNKIEHSKDMISRKYMQQTLDLKSKTFSDAATNFRSSKDALTEKSRLA